MLVGIDVGGTCTDGALIVGGRIAKVAKVPTRHEALLECLLAALDDLLTDVEPGAVRRIVFSTSLVTNLIAQGNLEAVALLLLPGPGVNPSIFGFAEPCYYLPGAIDYRGREIVPLDPDTVITTLERVAVAGLKKVAVAGKFSCRNNSHELAIAKIAGERFPQLEVELGHRVAGMLNFPRRAATTRLTLATRSTYEAFLDRVLAALARRGLSAPAFLLKADGGALPIAMGRKRPVEAIFSGPAAAALGSVALAGRQDAAVVLDVGGTTTDLALILNGRPLLASRGAEVQGYYTQTRTLAVRSVPVGGDSAVRVHGQVIEIGPERLGRAFCLGGPVATPTDAMRCLGLTELGDKRLADEAMSRLGSPLKLTAAAMAGAVLDAVDEKLSTAVKSMFYAWEKEPAYRVWEVMQKRKGHPGTIIGIGGAAAVVAPRVAQKLGCDSVMPKHAASANAIGAALARPTIYITLHADTDRGSYSIEELAYHGTFPNAGSASLTDARKLARKHLMAEADRLGVDGSQAEELYAESFNMVRGWVTSGRIIDVVMQLAPGLVPDWEGE